MGCLHFPPAPRLSSSREGARPHLGSRCAGPHCCSLCHPHPGKYGELQGPLRTLQYSPPPPGGPRGSDECPSSHSWLPFPCLEIFFWSPGQVMLKIPVKNTSSADPGSWRPWACWRNDSPAGLGKQKCLDAFGLQRGWQIRRCYKWIPGYRPPKAPWRMFHR